MEYDMEEWINDLIWKLNEENPRGIRWDDIVEYAEALQWSRGNLEFIISDLLENGTLYEPTIGSIKLALPIESNHLNSEIQDLVVYARIKILEGRKRKNSPHFDLRIWNVPEGILQDLMSVCKIHGFGDFTTYKRD